MALAMSFSALILTIILNWVGTINLNKKADNLTDLEQKNVVLQSIIDEKDIEIKKLQEMNTDLKLKQLEFKLLEIDNELSIKLQAISDIIENIKVEN
jgi:hypothetical protein